MGNRGPFPRRVVRTVMSHHCLLVGLPRRRSLLDQWRQHLDRCVPAPNTWEELRPAGSRELFPPWATQIAERDFHLGTVRSQVEGSNQTD